MGASVIWIAFTAPPDGDIATAHAKLRKLVKEGYSGPFFCSQSEPTRVVQEVGMTVIGAYIDKSGDAMVLADSCVSNSDGTAAKRHDGTKTIRVNDEWALALAGSNYGTGLLGACLHGNEIIAQDTFAEIERLGLTRNDLNADKLVSALSNYFMDSSVWLPAITGDAHVLVVGSNGGQLEVLRWPSKEKGWSEPERHVIGEEENLFVLIAPNRISWMNVGLPVEEVFAKLLEHYAEHFPDLVDTNARVRKLSRQFHLDPHNS